MTTVYDDDAKHAGELTDFMLQYMWAYQKQFKKIHGKFPDKKVLLSAAINTVGEVMTDIRPTINQRALHETMEKLIALVYGDTVSTVFLKEPH